MSRSISVAEPETRFEFGANWQSFLGVVNESRIRRASSSLQQMLHLNSLSGLRLLDIGSGSGLFSLAARRLGAQVHSFDYDRRSVACTRELKRRYFPGDASWTVEEGSVLDEAYLRRLGEFDIVYSWGVLHHTGQMWDAIDQARRLVRSDGRLYIAIYNDRGRESRRWHQIKRIYCALPRPVRPLFAAAAYAPYELRELGKSLLKLRPREYVHAWTGYSQNRGMSRWHDIVDWVGGYPYEYAAPEAVEAFLSERGFSLVSLKRDNGIGCNEFLFRRSAAVQVPLEGFG